MSQTEWIVKEMHTVDLDRTYMYLVQNKADGKPNRKASTSSCKSCGSLITVIYLGVHQYICKIRQTKKMTFMLHKFIARR